MKKERREVFRRDSWGSGNGGRINTSLIHYPIVHPLLMIVMMMTVIVMMMMMEIVMMVMVVG